MKRTVELTLEEARKLKLLSDRAFSASMDLSAIAGLLDNYDGERSNTRHSNIAVVAIFICKLLDQWSLDLGCGNVLGPTPYEVVEKIIETFPELEKEDRS
jgi:hypothetical protein